MKKLAFEIKQYLVVTGCYWTFTITDGALRMLVVLYFYGLGYSPLQIAMLFLLYEFFGVVTNLLGGWLGARLGLNKTMQLGMALQVFSLVMLSLDAQWLTVPYVMLAQAFSGIAKDLNKMSAKSAIKLLLPRDDQQVGLYKWVAFLTGSKNALKGVGFFVGGALLASVGFSAALLLLALVLGSVFVLSHQLLRKEFGKVERETKFSQLFSKSREINLLSAARFFLFGARDVWFVVALPVYFQQSLNWSHSSVGAFMAAWIMGYGAVQSFAPSITGQKKGRVPVGSDAIKWLVALAMIPALIAVTLGMEETVFNAGIDGTIWNEGLLLVVGLMLFGGVFAINSAIHSYLILSYAKTEGVSLDVGFYYMANALGRLTGTIISGWAFQVYGLAVCLWVSSVFLMFAILVSFGLPRRASSLQA